MDRTPNQRLEILELAGSAADIEHRGREIERLGEQMTAAAGLLDDIDAGAECRGKSLDKIKDVVGDARADLRTAGERYAPSGRAIAAYGEALGTAQRSLTTLLPELEELWNAYSSVEGRFERDSRLPDPEPGESVADRTSAADLAIARSAWEERAVDYEGVYDTWIGAYEEARTGIARANDAGVEDSWLDNMLPAIDVLLTVLSYVGIALAVVACIIGGPFILAAALVGLAALALTIAKVAGGRGNGWDIAMAAVGVFPFGKAFSLANGLRTAASGTRMLTAGRGLLDMGSDMLGAGFRNGSRIRGVVDAGQTARVFHDAGAGALNQNGSRVLREFFRGVSDGPSVTHRLLQGYDAAQANVIRDGVGELSNRARGNLSQFLGSTANGGVAQAVLDGGSSNAVIDFVDAVGKGATGFAYDRATGGWF